MFVDYLITHSTLIRSTRKIDGRRRICHPIESAVGRWHSLIRPRSLAGDARRPTDPRNSQNPRRDSFATAGAIAHASSSRRGQMTRRPLSWQRIAYPVALRSFVDGPGTSDRGISRARVVIAEGQGTSDQQSLYMAAHSIPDRRDSSHNPRLRCIRSRGRHRTRLSAWRGQMTWRSLYMAALANPIASLANNPQRDSFAAVVAIAHTSLEGCCGPTGKNSPSTDFDERPASFVISSQPRAQCNRDHTLVGLKPAALRLQRRYS